MGEQMTRSGVLHAGKIPSLDGLRALAIAIVIWGHTDIPMLIKGSTGVTIFFFLSGYLITTLLRMEADNRGRISIRDFYLRRVFRILPPLYIALALAIVLSLTGAIASSITGAGIASSAGFWTNYFIIFEGREGLPGAMNALWSLAVEEHYYLAFPLIYVAMRRWLPSRLHQTLVLVGICLAIMAWRVFLAGQGASWDRLYLSTDTRADAILWGSVMAISCNPVFEEARQVTLRWMLTPILLASAGVFYLISRTPDSFGMTVGYTIQSLSLFGVFIPLVLAPKSVIGRVLNWRPVAFVGVLSYTLYLIHRPVLELADTWLALPHLVEVGIALLVSIAFAYGMYRLVDVPMGVLRKHISHTGDIRTPAHRQASRVSA